MEISEKMFNMDKFIRTMRSHPKLWNMSIEQYSKRSKKDHVWIQVCRDMYEGFDGFTSKTKYMIGKNLRKKWKNLRTCYSRELRKRKKSEETSTRHRPYLYYDDLSFLNLERMQNGGNLTDESTLPTSSTKDQTVVKSSDTSAATVFSVVDPPKDATTRKFTFTERRVVNIGYFVKSLQKLNHHSRLECNLSDMVITAETRNGWNVGVVFRCEVCHIETIVWLDDPDLKVVPITPDGVNQLVPILQKSNVNIAKEKKNNAPEVQKKSSKGPTEIVGTEAKFSLPKPPSQSEMKTRSITANSSPLHSADTNDGSPIGAIPVIKQVATGSALSPISAIPIIKQEPISPCKDMTPLSNNTQSSSGGTTLVQLTFCVDNLDGSSNDESLGGISFKPSSQGIRVSLADPPEIFTETPNIRKDALKSTSEFENPGGVSVKSLGQVKAATTISVAGLSESISIAPDVDTHKSVVLPVDLNLVKKEIVDYETTRTSERVVRSSNLVSDNVCKLSIASITSKPKTLGVSNESLVRTLTISTDNCPGTSTAPTEFCPGNSILNSSSSTTLTEHLPGHLGTPIQYQSKPSPIPVEDLSVHPSVSSEKPTTAQLVLVTSTLERKAVGESFPEKNQSSSKRGVVDVPTSNNSKKLATDHRNTNL